MKLRKHTIKELRKDKGLTQPELAEKLGISETYLRFIETGKRSPSRKLLLKISDFFNVELDEIICIGKEISVEKENVIESLLQKLIENEIVTDPLAIDKNTEEIIMMAVRVELNNILNKKES